MNPAQLLLSNTGFTDQLFINGMGDIVFDLGNLDHWYEAYDVTTRPTPEPASLLLLATGALGLAAFAMRRRFVAVG